jgi:long-chain acyl-CoA synthetase
MRRGHSTIGDKGDFMQSSVLTRYPAYPAEVPREIHPEQYRSLGQFFEDSFQRFADRRFSVCMEKWMTYGELDALSKALGAWLQSISLAPGARVAVMLPNLPQFAVSICGVLRAGFVCVNVNPLYTARELEHQIKDSGATAIIILDSFLPTLAQVIDRTPLEHVLITGAADLLGAPPAPVAGEHAQLLGRLGQSGGLSAFTQALAAGRELALAPDACNYDSIAFLQYTGGTTGLSKGAVLTHRNIIAGTLQADAWFTPALARAGDTAGINSIAALPLYHIFALTLCFLAIRQGSHLTLIPNPRDFDGFVKTLQKRPFHLLPAVNTLFNALLMHPEFGKLDFSSLCVSQAGGMAASEGTAKRWFEVTGCTMIEGWGMSETVAIGTNNPVNSRSFSGSIGLPLPSIEIAIKDDEGNTLPFGQPGELCIKGPNVMAGYYNQPAETAAAFTSDGFMRSGDIAVMQPDGYSRIVDRKKDMILVSGFNVFPNEIENVISLCPGVLECAAVGVADESQGESIRVYVVRKDPALSEEAVMRHCHEHLTGYKRPRSIEFLDALPKTNVGKILRRELRALKKDVAA